MLIFSYLNREVLANMFAVTFLVLLIIMSSRFIFILDQAASGDIATDVLFKIIFFRMPNFISLILPLGFFIGVLLAYGRLYVESEMVVLSTSGMSPSRLLFYTAVPAFLLMLFMAFNALYLAPAGEDKVQKILADPKTKESLGVLIPGQFRSFNRNRQTVYVEQLNEDKTRMQTVFLSSVSKDANREKYPRVQLVLSESARIVLDETTGDKYIELYNGYNYDGAAGRNDYRVAQFDTYGVKISDQRSAVVRREERDAVPTIKLFGTDNPAYQATLQWRLSLPMIIPVVTMIALSLSRTTARQGRYVKLFPAIAIYMIYLVCLQFARGGIEQGTLSPLIGVWPVHLGFFLLGLVLYYGNNIWYRYLRPESKLPLPVETSA